MSLFGKYPPWKVYPPEIFYGEFLLVIIPQWKFLPWSPPPKKKDPKRILTLLKTSP
jgi:hypothetical protein